MSTRNRNQAKIIGSGLNTCLERATHFADRNVPVLIVGGTGTGKEILARAYAQRWCAERLFSVERHYCVLNCTGKPGDVLLGDLFGVQEGAFTGAVKSRDGYIHRYKIICLDELGDAGPHFQAAILRLVEYGEYSRLGGNTTEKTAVHFIASTNRADCIREDLRYRFRSVEVSPLWQRPDDLVEMVLEFARDYAVTAVRKRFIIWAGSHTWPGNVRELLASMEEASLTNTLDIPSRIPLGKYGYIRPYQENLLYRLRAPENYPAVPIERFPEEFRKARDLKILGYQFHDEDQAKARRALDINFFLEKIVDEMRAGGTLARFAVPQSVPAAPAAASPTKSEQQIAMEQALLEAGSIAALAALRNLSPSTMRGRLVAAGIDAAKLLRGRRKRRLPSAASRR